MTEYFEPIPNSTLDFNIDIEFGVAHFPKTNNVFNIVIASIGLHIALFWGYLSLDISNETFERPEKTIEFSLTSSPRQINSATETPALTHSPITNTIQTDNKRLTTTGNSNWSINTDDKTKVVEEKPEPEPAQKSEPKPDADQTPEPISQERVEPAPKTQTDVKPIPEDLYKWFSTEKTSEPEEPFDNESKKPIENFNDTSMPFTETDALNPQDFDVVDITNEGSIEHTNANADPNSTDIPPINKTDAQINTRRMDIHSLVSGKTKYPAIAQKRGLEGDVELTLYFNSLGEIDRIEVTKSSGHSALDNAALKSAKKTLKREVDNSLADQALSFTLAFHLEK